MTLVKGEVEKISEGSKVDVTLTTGGHIQAYWSGLEKDEVKMKSAPEKKEADVTLTADIVDEIKVEA